jgi:hypothetical protein
LNLPNANLTDGRSAGENGMDPFAVERLAPEMVPRSELIMPEQFESGAVARRSLLARRRAVRAGALSFWVGSLGLATNRERRWRPRWRVWHYLMR